MQLFAIKTRLEEQNSTTDVAYNGGVNVTQAKSFLEDITEQVPEHGVTGYTNYRDCHKGWWAARNGEHHAPRARPKQQGLFKLMTQLTNSGDGHSKRALNVYLQKSK